MAQTKEERNAADRARYAANRDATLAKNTAYRIAHREEINAKKRERAQSTGYNRKYYAENRERELAETKAWQAVNGEKIKATRRSYQAANGEAIKLRRRVYSAARRDKINARNRTYRLSNPDKARARDRRRYARKIENGGSHTSAEWQALCIWFGGVCLCCGANGALTRDHVIPVVAGGSSNINNIQPLCKSCNDMKQAQTIDYRDPATLTAFIEALKAGGK